MFEAGSDSGDWNTVVRKKTRKKRKADAKEPEPVLEKEESQEEVPAQAEVASPNPPPAVDVLEAAESSPIRKGPTKPPMTGGTPNFPATDAQATQQQEPVPAPEPTSPLQEVAAPTNGALKKDKPKQQEHHPAPVVDADGWSTVPSRKNKRRQKKKAEAAALAQPQEEVDDIVDTPDEPVLPQEPVSSQEKKSGKKKRKKKKKAAAPPPSDQIQPSAELPLEELIKEIITKHGSNDIISLNEVCSHLESRTKHTWKYYKPKHGPMRQFLESSGFFVNPQSGTVALRPPAPPNPKPSPPNPSSVRGAPPAPRKAKPKPPEEKEKRTAKKRKGKKKGKSPSNAKDGNSKKPKEAATGSWANTIGLIVVGCASVAALLIGGSKLAS